MNIKKGTPSAVHVRVPSDLTLGLSMRLVTEPTFRSLCLAAIFYYVKISDVFDSTLK